MATLRKIESPRLRILARLGLVAVAVPLGVVIGAAVVLAGCAFVAITPWFIWQETRDR